MAIVFLAVSLPAAAQQQLARTFHDCPDCPEMVRIAPGSFMMGASKEQADYFRQHVGIWERTQPIGMTHDLPQHSVRISRAFALGKYPVTRGEFAKFIQDTGYRPSQSCFVRTRSGRGAWGGNWQQPGFEQKDRDPVVCVSWEDANAYIGWLNKKAQISAGTANGGAYRLPSEAEYEYAARGGTTTLRWWGEDIGQARAVCIGCKSLWDGQQPAAVGLFGANPYGLYDILGNVWEWAQDCWNSDYQQAPVDGSAWLIGDCNLRVERGGSFEAGIWAVSSVARTRDKPDGSSRALGFRIAKSLPEN